MEIEIPVKSSTHPEEPYTVTFSYDGKRLSIFCTCPAGIWGKLCKHKTGLLDNNPKMLQEPSDAEQLTRAHELIKKTSTLEVYQQLAARMGQIQSQQQKLKKELSDVRGMLGRRLQDGIE